MTAPARTAVATRDGNSAPAVAKRQEVRDQLAKYHDAFARVLPKHITPERLTTLALVAATKTPAILDCSPESIALALVRVSQWGLEIGTTAHLVPFKGVCTPIADWKGLVQLMIRSGHVRDVKARAVYAKEHFRHEEGANAILEHHPITVTAARGPLVAAYAIAWLKGGVTTFDVMGRDEIEAIRQRANSRDSDAWKNHYDEMAKKTAIRRLAKRMPHAATLADAVTWDEDPERAMHAFARAVGVPADDRDSYEPISAPRLGSGDAADEDDGDTPTASAPVRVAANGEQACPKCQGPMYDNRLTKKNPKSPDFKCKDRDNCDGVIWPPRGDAASDAETVAELPLGATTRAPRNALAEG
jgi:recombination protein RecT